MDTILKSIQNAWDQLEKDGTLTEEAKEKFPRPETNEEACKILAYSPIFSGCGYTPVSPLLTLLLIMLLASPGFWGSSLPEQKLFEEINKCESTQIEESQDKKIDE